jgi:hypothetical protein
MRARKRKGIAHAEPPKVDFRKLDQPGDYPGVEEKAARDLARAIHWSESTDCSISWSAQERAMNFYNQHGFAATLDEMFRLRKLALPENILSGDAEPGEE